MPWGRILVAVLVSALTLGGAVSTALMISGAVQVNLPSTPGVASADAAALRSVFDDAAAGRDEALIQRLTEEADRQQAQAQIDRIQAMLPPAQPTSSRLVLFQTRVGTDGLGLTGVHEHVYPDHTVRAQTVLHRSDSEQPWRIVGFHVNVATKADLSANAFSLAGKSPGFIAFVAATVVCPIFMLATFLTALFWKNLPRRWLWLIATVIGVGKFIMNGATGAIGFAPISIQLLGSGATWSGSAFDAWLFSVSLPLGAVAFWVTRALGGKRAVTAVPSSA